MKFLTPEERFPCSTGFTVKQDNVHFCYRLGRFLRDRAQEGWWVESNHPNRPTHGRVFHVKPDDLAAPPPGVRAKLHVQEESDGVP